MFKPYIEYQFIQLTSNLVCQIESKATKSPHTNLAYQKTKMQQFQKLN